MRDSVKSLIDLCNFAYLYWLFYDHGSNVDVFIVSKSKFLAEDEESYGSASVKLHNLDSNLDFSKLCIIFRELFVFALMVHQGNPYGHVTEDEVGRTCSTH